MDSNHIPSNVDLDSLPRPGSFRRTLIICVAVSMFMLSVFTAYDVARFGRFGISVPNFLLLLFGVWGFSYMVYLWISFFAIGLLKLRGCEFTAIRQVLKVGSFHWCVDSVLNSVMDNLQIRTGISPRLLKTESAQKWVIGTLLLLAMVVVIAKNVFGLGADLALEGVFSTVYVIYDKTIHQFSIGRSDLTGKGDYDMLIEIMIGIKKEQN